VWVARVIVALCIAFFTLTPGGRSGLVGDGRSVWRAATCLTCSPAWLADIISNIALFVPLGAALAWRQEMGNARIARAVVLGAAASLAIETLQFYGVGAGRIPALADVLSNTAGTWLGVVLVMYLPTCVAPSETTARVLARGWAALFVVVWSALAVALSPAAPATSAQPRAVVSPSSLPFTPGYGWYAAEAESAMVNGVSIAHRGTGPVLVAAERTDSVTASVVVRGRDARNDVVPIVFVHDPRAQSVDPRVTRAHLLFAQYGRDAAVTSDLTAYRWGLYTPLLLAPDAFADDTSPLSISCVVTARAWYVRWSRAHASGGVLDVPDVPSRDIGARDIGARDIGARDIGARDIGARDIGARDRVAPDIGVRAVSLSLSPAIGWALVQSVVPVGASIAPLLTVLWLVLWFAPVGYWAGMARRSLSRVTGFAHAAAWASALLVAAWGAAQATGTAPLSWVLCGVGVLSSMAGALASGHARSGRR